MFEVLSQSTETCLAARISGKVTGKVYPFDRPLQQGREKQFSEDQLEAAFRWARG